MKALISVLLPVYNVNPTFFSESLDSILNQDYDNFEIVIVFDPSNDTARDQELQAVIEERMDDKRIRILKRSTKSGFTVALNEGLELCRGEYVARMDSDDIAMRNRFSVQLDYISNSGDAVVGTWADVINDNYILGKMCPPSSYAEIRDSIILHNPLLHPSILVKKGVFDQVGPYNPHFDGAEDYEFYTRLIWKGYRLSNIPEYLLHLRETSGSIMRGTKTWKKARKAAIRVKMNAIMHYNMQRPKDILYGIISPLSYLVTPSMANQAKSSLGWFRKVENIPTGHN